MTKPSERDAAAEKEWNDYQEHLRIGGKALHFRSIFGLGWSARDAEVKRLREALKHIESSLGDRLLAKGPLSEKYAYAILNEIKEALKEGEE